jgi:hypothetical protein
MAIQEGVAGGGYRGVARDSWGLQGAWCTAYPCILDPLTIEALALRYAVSFAVERRLIRVVFEVDCAELVRTPSVWNYKMF